MGQRPQHRGSPLSPRTWGRKFSQPMGTADPEFMAPPSWPPPKSPLGTQFRGWD